MSKLSSIDKNFSIKSSMDKPDIVFKNALDAPFEINGVFYEDNRFRRMSEDVAKKVSEGVLYLHKCTAGGRVRFKTNSPYVAINAKIDELGEYTNMTLAGSAGFDMYIKKDGKYTYFKSFMPPLDIIDGYESVVEFGDSIEREICINFPSYSHVCELYIGVSDKAIIKPPAKYRSDKKIVYYGSSITQGASASRPGNSYQNMILRELDCDYLNLGFSGSAKAEDEIINYVKNLSMDVFVYDYDFNAPTLEHLKNTHEKMFKEIRNKKPDLPIIIMSRPKVRLSEEEVKRLEVIEATYKRAKDKNDNNVYFIPGYKLMEICGNEGTVDDCHPNDLGFYSMSKALLEVLRELI